MRALLILLSAVALLPAQSPPNPYIGAGGCASSNCHGATTPLPESESRILGNEYATWSVSDKHARAYQALVDPRGKRMAEILKITDPTRDRRCASCHVAGSPERSRSDGVACEACHGPAEQWLGPHTRKDSHAASLRTGMIDTRRIDIRAKTCLACHLGTGDQVVDHELIAAGHPDLAFELESFDAAQPAHHRPRPAADRVRAWATGQAAALAEGMRLLANDAARKWPEFANLECYQCHHDLRAESWRIQRGYGGRKPGALQVNTARYEVLRELVALAAPEQKPAFDGSISRLGDTVSNRFTDGSAIADAARAVERIADALSNRFLTQTIDAAAVVRALSANIQRIADSGVNAAEQATLSLDALGRRPDALTPLYDYLEHPSTYKPSEFAALFRRAAGE